LELESKPIGQLLVEPEPEPKLPDLDANDHFTCLGFDGDAYYYRPHNTGQVVRLTRAAHTSTNFASLAGLNYWRQLCPNERGGIDWTQAAATLFAISAERGVYNPDRIRGRGAWWDNKRTILHLGDQLVVDGKRHPVLKPFDSSYLYHRMPELAGPGEESPLTDAEALILCEIAERFHWEVPASGMLLAGWVTLAPICGALPWRPHVWLTAAAGSGKSAILDRYVAPLLADMGLIVAGNTTEAGLRQTLRCDALPVVFDEAESNEKADQVRMQNILSLARVASSESHATLIKGSPGGDVTRFNIRSMFLMSSIATALKQGADRSRFAQLTLRSPNELPKDERTKHWEQLDRDLDKHISSDIARRLIARTVNLIPIIRASVRVFTRVAAERFDSQRLGDQYGTLLAGAWSLMSSQVATDDEARALIDQNNWEPYSQTTEVPDEQRCLQRILQYQVRVETDEKTLTRTLGELVEIAAHHRSDRDVETRQAKDTLERYGLRVETDDQILFVSNTAEAVATILRDTQWSHSWGTLLSRLKGATKAGPTRFRGCGAVSRAVALQIKDL
jgi:putative DNA primase/helicase